MSPSIYMDTVTTKMVPAETTKQRVAETMVTSPNYVEEDVKEDVSQQQRQSSSRSSFVLNELLLVVEGDVVNIYCKSMSKNIVSLTTN